MVTPRKWLVLGLVTILAFDLPSTRGDSDQSIGQTEEVQIELAGEKLELRDSEHPENESLVTGTRSIGKWLADRAVNDPRPIDALLGDGLLANQPTSIPLSYPLGLDVDRAGISSSPIPNTIEFSAWMR